MTFTASGDAYDRYMGRYSASLAPRFADFAGVAGGRRALDVGCGSGALTGELVRRLGAERVAAADPSPQLLAACRARLPDVDLRAATAERLPWQDATFDVALAQLVLSFVADGPAAAREMRRVVRTGGVVAACMWAADGGMEMLRVFWDAVLELDPAAPDESRMPYRTVSELRALWQEAGLREVETAPLDVSAGYESFDDFWNALLGGVGPAGAYAASLDEPRRAALGAACRRRLGSPCASFRLAARAWAVRGFVAD
ncbi:MAG: class I SAM-dependent methyltransferase [Polyangiaceae bacterium]|nr:class I SAM-dependent methyltransferase [Polyangiaceae bacterium]